MLHNKIRYLLLLLLIGVLSVLYNEYVMGIIFLMTLITPVFLFIHVCYLCKKAGAELVSVVHVASKGERIPISIQMSNPTIFPISDLKIYMTVKNGFSMKEYSKELSMSMDSHSNHRVTCYLQSEFTGNLTICLKGIRSYDYLKLFSLKRKLRDEIKVAVLPDFYEIDENYISNKNNMIVESDYYSSTKIGDDHSEVFAVREYREGDRPQQIHWKLSRKHNQLMIKEFSEPLNCSVLIFIDFFIPSQRNILSYMDALLECGLSISYSFLQKKQIHYLSWYDEVNTGCRRVCIEQEKDMYEAEDGLLQIRPYTDQKAALVAYPAEHPNSQLTDLIYITGELSDFQVDFINLLHSNTKRLIYIKDTVANFNQQAETGEKKLSGKQDLIKNAASMGLELYIVNIDNLREDIENLKMG
jgi:hypothetical protein